MTRVSRKLAFLTALFFTVLTGVALAADGKVGFEDISGDSEIFVRAAPIAASSDGRFSVIVFSDQKHILRAVYLVSEDIEKSFDKDAIMLQALPKKEEMAVIELYCNGQQTGTLTVHNDSADTVLREQITAAALDGIKRHKC